MRAPAGERFGAGAGVVGLVGRDLNTPVFVDLAEGLQHAIGDARRVLLASWHGDRLGEVLESFWSLPAEGVVVLGDVDRPDDVSRFARRGLPVVVVGDGVEVPNVARVILDPDMVARLPIDRLARSGRRRIGMIAPSHGSPGHSAGERDFLAAVDDAGLKGAIVRAQATVDGGGSALRGLIEGFPGMDGVVAHNDLMAVGAVREAADLGIRVPDQVAVISAEDMGHSGLVTPALTSVRPDNERLVEAVTSALGRLRDAPGLIPEIGVVPVELVVRQSA